MSIILIFEQLNVFYVFVIMQNNSERNVLSIKMTWVFDLRVDAREGIQVRTTMKNFNCPLVSELFCILMDK